ncbi:hypothetical protein LZ30DRAFT_734793 [Colletotrichum cereale]|nr:hypothetical protein LZ30DRAFT_734793 [Colletotrichum cereale]
MQVYYRMALMIKLAGAAEEDNETDGDFDGWFKSLYGDRNGREGGGSREPEPVRIAMESSHTG